MSRPYAGPIVDAHHHLWDLTMDRHPWLRQSSGNRGDFGDLGPLRANYLPDDYRRDAAEFDIAATVHIEASWQPEDCVGETAWLEQLPKPAGIASRYVVHVPLADPQAAALLDAQLAFDRTTGVRDILSWDPIPERRFAGRDGLMGDRQWRLGLAQLGRHGLSFDLMIYPRQHAEAARLADDFPNQVFILNHCGSPIDRDREGMRRWREGLRELARRPNVTVEISDLVAYDHDWTLESLGDVVRHCVDCFGPDRAMFGSDAPVCSLHATISEVWGSFIALTADLSEAEQDALFRGTATRVYRIAA